MQTLALDGGRVINILGSVFYSLFPTSPTHFPHVRYQTIKHNFKKSY